MRKNLILQLLIAAFILLAPYKVMASLKHVVEVKRIGFWAPDYLTVTNNYDNALWISAPTSLQFMSVITEINGQDTKNMDEREFYKILDASTSVDLSYMTKIRGENKTFHEKLKKGAGLGIVCGYSIDYNSRDHYEAYPNSYRGFIASDYDMDFFQYCTYDYAFGDENDIIEKKQLLRPLTKELDKRGMKRVDNNPDIYIYVTHDANKNIETVYMPQQVSSTNAGINGRIIYYGNVTTGYANSSSTTVNTETGQIKSFTTTDVYLQVTLLDAKRTKEEIIPKVWQFTYNKRFDKNVESDFMETLLTKNAQNYPFDGSISNYYGYIQNSPRIWFTGAYAWKGTTSADVNTPISDVNPGGWADQLGVKKGDEVWVYYTYTYSRGKGRFYPITYDYLETIFEDRGVKIGKKKIKDVSRLPRTNDYKFIYEDDAHKL